MSDTTIAMSDEPGLSPTSAATTSSNNSSTLPISKGINLSSSTSTKDYPDQSNSPDVYKNNNNNNNNIEDSVSPPSRDAVTNFSIESHLLGSEDSNSNNHNKQIFKRRDSFNSDECKMNISPKERERTLSTVMEEDQEEMNMQYSPKSTGYPPSTGGESGVGLSKFSQDDGGDYSQHHHLATTLQQKRQIFNEGADMRDHQHQPHSLLDYGRVNHESSHQQQSRGGGISQHHFMGSQGQNEEMSDNEEEMVCDDYESDSDTNEPRITVREALMNRALAAAAAAAAAAGSSSAASHFAAAAGERVADLFSSEQGGSGRTSRSGGVSPSSSPGVRSSSTSGIASGRNNESSSSGSSQNTNNINNAGGGSGSSGKESFVNGHTGLRPPVSHSSGERYHSLSQHHSSSSLHHGQQQHQRSSSYGAHHHHGGHQTGHSSSTHSSSATSTSGNGSKHSGQPYRENLGIKSENKSHSSSPLQSEVKPENLAALSNLSNIQNLLNLASLGSLAVLQQSLPGLLSSVSGATGAGSPGNNGSGSSPSHISPHAGGTGGSSSSPSAATSGMNAPLNLTHSSGGSLSSSKSHHHPHHHIQGGGGHTTGASSGSSGNNSSSNNNHSSSSHHSSNSNRGQHSSSPFPHHHSAFSNPSSYAGGSQSGMNPASMLSGGGGLIPPNLAAYFSQAAAVAAGAGGRSGSPSSPFIPNSSQLSSSLSHAAANVQSPGSLPQLVLASGQIMQGIQGAQLLIPTSQGIMTQMILTIPLTQPGSPQMNTPGQTSASPAIGAAGGQSSSSPHSRNARNQSRSHQHGLPQCSANSPPIASTVPPSASPDYSGPGGTMSGSLLNLSPHLVNQSLGAHIPLDKMGMDRTSNLNGIRSTSMKRDNSGSVISPNPNLPMSALYPPKMSPCSEGGHESDKCSEGGDSDQMVDGINLDEIKEFAKAFKLRRLSLGLTQTQVGQALSVTEGPAYSQSAICRFEKLDITPKSAQKIKPVLERWMKEAEDRYKNGHQNLNEFVGMEPSKKRKRRTSFTPQALEILNTQFERNTHPSGAEITTLAHQLGYEREVIRIWFCNKRQALKNTVRMMSKGSSPI